MRTCVKATCSEPAAATMALRYAERVVWLRDLLPERDPGFLELCSPHADRLTAPVGWIRLDERSADGAEAGAAETAPARPADVEAPEPVPLAAVGGVLLPLR
jgi:hypothetical protein